MEAGSDLQEGSYPAVQLHPPRRRLRNARKDLQQRALPCPIASDDSQDLTMPDFEGDIAKRPKDVFAVLLIESAQTAKPPQIGERSPRNFDQGIPQRIVT